MAATSKTWLPIGVFIAALASGILRGGITSVWQQPVGSGWNGVFKLGIRRYYRARHIKYAAHEP